MGLLLAALLAQDPPPPSPDRGPDLAVSLLASYFEVHQASVGDAFGASLLLQAPLGDTLSVDVGGRWFGDDAGGNDFDLGIATLGLSAGGGGHGGWQYARFSFGAGLAGLVSNDLDDALQLGGYGAFQLDFGCPDPRVRLTFRYELIVPEGDAGMAGKDFGLIQAFSLGLTVAF